MKVLIVGHQLLVREGLKRVLSNLLGRPDFPEAVNAEAALQQADLGHWDLVILDVRVPARPMSDGIRLIRIAQPKVPILVVSTSTDAQYARWALSAGAQGYITTDSRAEEFVFAARRLIEGGRYIVPALAERLAVDLADPSGKARHERLSPREFEILCQIASGKTVTRIAEELLLSVKTVSTHRSRIMKKMDMQISAELIRYALRHGLVE